MGGGMEVNKNKYIEEWNAARENLEHNFRWTRRNFALVGLFGIALPILVYKGIVKEFHMQDEDAGRPHRKFLAHLEPGPLHLSGGAKASDGERDDTDGNVYEKC